MIKQAHDLYPKFLADELIRLARLERNWVHFKHLGDGVHYQATCEQASFIRGMAHSGADLFGLWAASHWLVDGPKLFRPTEAQCAALEQIEVNLELHEYAQPYPALLVELPPGRYPPFECVLCHRTEELLSCVLHSVDRNDDITTTVATDGRAIEVSLQQYDESLMSLQQSAGKALRVACNACLALVNFGCQHEALFPKQLASDRQLASEQTERGARARERIKLAPKLVTFDQEVQLHRTQGGGHGSGAGGEKSFHWRRGHWHTVACGKGKTERKRVLYPPTMVRPDLMLGESPAETSTTYKG